MPELSTDQLTRDSTANPQRRLAVMAFVVLIVIWGSNWAVVKIGLQYAGPFDYAALRGVCGVVGLFVVLLLRRGPVRPQAVTGTALLGLFQNTLFLTLTNLALVSGGAGKTAVLVFTMPFWTLVLAWPILGERIRGLQWLAVALAFIGLILILDPGASHGTLLSEGLAILAGIAWSVSVIIAKKLRAKHQLQVLSLTAWQMLFGALPLVVLAWLVPSRPIVWSGAFLLSLAYAGFVATVVGWLFWLYILHHLPAGTASLNALAIPVVAVLSAWLIFAEVPTSFELLGMLVIGAALLVLSFGRGKQRSAPPAP